MISFAWTKHRARIREMVRRFNGVDSDTHTNPKGQGAKTDVTPESSRERAMLHPVNSRCNSGTNRHAIDHLEPRLLLSATLPGDITGDGFVDLKDVDGWVISVGPATPATASADLDLSGVVDLGDFDLVWANLGRRQLPVVAYDGHTVTIDGVLHGWFDNPSDFGATYEVTDRTLLFGPDGLPDPSSVSQGFTANCYLLAAAESIAMQMPGIILDRMGWDDDGGWWVKFTATTAGLPQLVVHTDNTLSDALYLDRPAELWSRVIEKAYAAFRTWNGSTSQNTMSSTGWGNGGAALAHLGMLNQAMPRTPQALATALVAGHPLIVHTTAHATGAIVPSHVYVITAITTGSNATITLANPWGPGYGLTMPFQSFWLYTFQFAYEGVS